MKALHAPLAFLGCLASATCFAFAQEHEWTNVDGKTIRAAFVTATAETVTIHLNEQDFVVPMGNLAPDSQILARELLAQNPAAVTLRVDGDASALPAIPIIPPPAPPTPPPDDDPDAPPPPIGSPASTLDFHTYRLSFMQSDRVMGLLKALGYSTVEYKSTSGEIKSDSIFTTVDAKDANYPLIIKVIDASKTSIFQPSSDGGRGSSGDLGGTYLHSHTTGAPEQRLFILYKKAYPEQLHSLLQLLRNEIDVPANQVVIEALVVEIDTDKVQELGLHYNLQRPDFNLNLATNALNQLQLKGRYAENATNWTDSTSAIDPSDYGDGTKASVRGPLGITASISAFVQDGHAEILSNPSVLVLDGRQAVIQVGSQVPTTNVLTTDVGAYTSIKYLQTGIVLNIRPRVSEDGSEVTMQVETIVSSASADSFSSNKVLQAPKIDNRQVQTFVRVADNTPFIIGGLVNRDEKKGSSGVPILSDIPLLGKLFKKRTSQSDKREVIIVLTPHVINTKEKSFSYVIPKDSKTFDSFDNLLFRNAYRIRDDDLFDLSFATGSNYYLRILENLRNLQATHPGLAKDEPVFRYLNDKVPGEEVIVRRMIWEIVHKSKYHEHIATEKILVFESNDQAQYGNKFKTLFLHNLLGGLKEKGENALVLDYADHKAKSQGPFEHPRALVQRTELKNSADFVERISLLNADDPARNTLLLSNNVVPPGVRGASSLEVLKGVLVLKRILALNSTMPVTIREFRLGRQIIFPTEQELKDKYHIVDYDAARFFYEIINYYPEFERHFNADSRAIIDRMKELSGQ